jgi:hypothetical protein
MKKYRILGLVFFAVLSLGAVNAASAYAEEEANAEWLSNGAPIAAAAAATVNMELLITELFEMKNFSVLCSIRLDGTVGPKFEDLISEMLNLSGELIRELVGNGILCEVREGCEGTVDSELWPELLPWETLLTLMADGTFLDHVHVAFEFTCLFMTVLATDLCEGLTSARMVNVVGGVEPVFSAGVGTELLECTSGGPNSGTIATEGTPLITLNGGQALTVSE